MVDDLLEDLPERLDKKTRITIDRLGDNGINVNDFFVLREQRNQGIGSATIETIINQAYLSEDIDYIVVNMGTDNMNPVEIADWLSTYGFDINECRDGHVDGLLELQSVNWNSFRQVSPTIET